jgi:hypothetical protein
VLLCLLLRQHGQQRLQRVHLIGCVARITKRVGASMTVVMVMMLRVGAATATACSSRGAMVLVRIVGAMMWRARATAVSSFKQQARLFVERGGRRIGAARMVLLMMM